MTSQRRMAREDFFRGLDRLDELDEDDAIDRPSIQKSTSAQRPATADAGYHRGPLEEPRADPSPKSKISSSPTRPPRGTNIPASLRRAQSDSASLRPVEKRGGKSKKKKTPPPIPADRQLFPGFCFYFIPNRAAPYVRELRIKYAIAHGASWAQTWNDSITHILVQPGLRFKELQKALPEQTLPEGIPILSDDWISDCVTRKTVLEVSQRRFLIKGMKSPYALEDEIKEITCTTKAHTASNGPGRQSKSIGPATPSKFIHNLANESPKEVSARRSPTSCLEETRPSDLETQSDKLDDLIDKMKETNYMALDDLTRHDPSFNFEDGFVLDPDDVTLEEHRWQCKSKNELGHNKTHPNAVTIDLLEQMANVYDRQGEQWRCQAFKRAAGTLKKQSTWIRTKTEARELPYIGESIAEKIQEVAYTGNLSRLDNIRSDPVYRVTELFRGIYGVGPAQAQAWTAAGYETLEQLLRGADLTPNQKIGIAHYEDFQTRIPRDEVRQHGIVVGEALKAIDPRLEFVIGGSYRRKSPDSGDIDIMITKEHAELGYLQAMIMENLVPQLKMQGFIVAELASSDDKDSSKWMGASCLPGMTTWRRLDLLFVPWAEKGAARLYWTGNDIFNRSLRLLASRKGMRLNQHGLFEDTMRGPGRVKITEGRRIAGESEREIFDILEVTYRPPEHRNP